MQRSPQFRSRRTRVFLVATIAAVVVALSAGFAAAAPPTVTVPPAGGGAILPPNLNGFDLAQVGYQQLFFWR